MASVKSAVVLAVAIGVAAIVGGVLVPVGIGEIVDDETVTLTQDEDTLVEVNGALDTNATSINSSNATLELTTDDQTISNTIGTGNETTYAFNEGDVVVGLESTDTAASPSQVTANYTYPSEFAQSGGASALWSNLDLFVILALLGIFVFAMREQF